MAVRVFLSYSHDDTTWRDALLKHLGGLLHTGQLVHFDDRQIKPGEEWDARIKGEFLAADIIILLVSPNFLGSVYCIKVELAGAIERAKAGQAKLVAIFCDDIDLESLPLAAFQCLPQDEKSRLKALAGWPTRSRSKPMAEIAAKVRGIVDEIVAARAAEAPG